MRKTLVLLTISFSAINLYAATPVFYVTPLISGQSSLIKGETGSAVYQVTNNTKYTLSSLGVARMPAGVSVNTTSVSTHAQYCNNPFTLAAGESCLLKVSLDSNALGTNLQGGPVVCSTPDRPVYCSQPYNVDQLNLLINKQSIPQDCQSNVANFNNELLQNFDSTTVFTDGWGPGRNNLLLSSANPDLSNCTITAGISWMQQRVVAAAEFWVRQKLNYCHHYNPDYATPLAMRNAAGNAGGFCNPAVDVMPGSVYYGKQARWNYSGQGSETMEQWVNNNRMWYGMDCSNTTAFIYNFSFGINAALGIPFDSETGIQAGQDGSSVQDQLTPNTQVPGDATKTLNSASKAGLLVCADGTTDPTPATPTMCAGHGGYLSRIDSSGKFKLPVTVASVAGVLQPGDLLFIAGRGGPDVQPDPDGKSSIVTHVIMWLGKRVGYGANDINPALIAPNDKPCQDPALWQPHVGDWVIVDSHYQGYDYRVLIQCFYLNDLWGVRRVIH